MLWLDDLRDVRARVGVLARIRRLSEGNPGDVAPVGGGVSEIRIHIGKGYRVYFARTGREEIMLLLGGDKASQFSDIRRALAMARFFKGAR